PAPVPSRTMSSATTKIGHVVSRSVAYLFQASALVIRIYLVPTNEASRRNDALVISLGFFDEIVNSIPSHRRPIGVRLCGGERSLVPWTENRPVSALKLRQKPVVIERNFVPTERPHRTCAGSPHAAADEQKHDVSFLLGIRH